MPRVPKRRKKEGTCFLSSTCQAYFRDTCQTLIFALFQSSLEQYHLLEVRYSIQILHLCNTLPNVPSLYVAEFRRGDTTAPRNIDAQTSTGTFIIILNFSPIQFATVVSRQAGSLRTNHLGPCPYRSSVLAVCTRRLSARCSTLRIDKPLLVLRGHDSRLTTDLDVRHPILIIRTTSAAMPPNNSNDKGVWRYTAWPRPIFAQTVGRKKRTWVRGMHCLHNEVEWRARI